ncbi:MAG: hypothetical protein Q8928_11165 [Bacteroidota bacterium]|nr:hypothetical protein [Bacteroidota bacterium]
MRKILFLAALITGAESLSINAQDAEKPAVKLSGYVRSESFFDTYKSAESRDGELYFYPLRKTLDATGKDLNQVSQLQMLGLQSRFRITGSGVSAFGAKASGVIEADFNGSADGYKNQMCLRLAALKLDWNKTQLILGQWWHPMSIPEFAPNTVLFASGMVFEPLNRSAQIRVTRQIDSQLKLIGALCSGTTHKAIEPTDNSSQRNSGLPDMQLQLQYGGVNSFFFALTGGYKFLKPYLTTTANNSTYMATKIIGSYNLQACIGYQLPELSIKVQGNLGENMTNYTMIGGYGQIENSANIKGEYDYANMKTMSLWTDLETKGTKFKMGLFAGYSENLGSNKNLIITNQLKKDFTRDADLKQVFRIAPRAYVISGPVDFGFEYSITGAVYGTYQGKSIKNTDKAVVNNRFLVSARYTF